MSGLPPIKFPPPKNKKQANETSAFKNYINAHPTMRAYAQTIFSSARNNGVDAVYLASLLWHESFAVAKARGVSVESILGPSTKYGQAVGIAQIMLSQHPNITAAQARNPNFAINFAAQYLKQGLNKYGTYQAAYNHYYNPHYQGNIFNDIPKGYVVTTTAKSPGEKAAQSVAVSTAEKDLTDPFVTIKNGKLVTTTQRGALKVFGAPVRRNEFMSTWQNLNDIYLAYTNKPVSLRAVKDIMASGKSRYKIIDILSRGPNFVGSPVWKQNSPGYEAVWKSIYGQNSTPDQNAIKYAIVNNLGAEGFASTLRSRPDYENSQEFKGNEASLSAVYTQVFGVPDQNGLNTVKQATKQGQTPDEFASWLRAQPEYKYSGEYKSKVVGVAQALGFITGQQATLGPDLTAAPPVSSNDPNAKPAGVV